MISNTYIISIIFHYFHFVQPFQDGPKCNIAVTKALGADFANNKPYFLSPTNPSDKIYCIWDNPHMIKLARGCLKHNQLYYQGIPLNWNFIVKLHELQQQRNINLGNKLTDIHINFHLKPMHVRTACETLSNDVADGIDQLRCDDYDDFNASEPTTKYLRICKNVFHILNYKVGHEEAGMGFKKPLNPSTANEIFQYFAEAKNFFEALEIDEKHTRNVVQDGVIETITTTIRKLAIKSQNGTPFFGYFYNMIAIEQMYTDFVLNGPLDELITFMFCQDHLETWFATVRSKLGKFLFLDIANFCVITLCYTVFEFFFYFI